LVFMLFSPCTADRVAKSGHQDAGPPRCLICAFPVCGIRAPFRWPRLPVGDEAGVCVLGLGEPGSLALPNLLAVVGVSAPLSASFAGWPAASSTLRSLEPISESERNGFGWVGWSRRM
jgi:hypothetical protein